MPTLNWIGKEAVVNHHLQVPFQLLKDVPNLACGREPGSGNLIVQGDNLVAFKALLPYYAGHLHRPALQHRQRRLGLQRQRKQPADPRMAGQDCRQGRGNARPA
jgi:hypothetical protein